MFVSSPVSYLYNMLYLAKVKVNNDKTIKHSLCLKVNTFQLVVKKFFFFLSVLGYLIIKKGSNLTGASLSGCLSVLTEILLCFMVPRP